jgi:hypothetical protein
MVLEIKICLAAISKEGTPSKNKQMRVKIEFEVELPDIPHTEEELEAYLRFSFRDNGELALINPFNDLGEPDPVFGTFEWNKI